jgi:hypothetical protein
MNHRAIRAVETYIAVYEAMGWEPPGSPKRLLKSISEIQANKSDPFLDLFEQVARLMAIVCAAKDIFFFQTVGRWALAMQSMERVDDSSLVVIEGANAPIREQFDHVEKMFAACLEGFKHQGKDWPPPEVEITKERSTFVHWNYSCVFVAHYRLDAVSDGRPRRGFDIEKSSVRKVPVTLLHLIGDQNHDKIGSAKVRETYQWFCGLHDPSLASEDVVSYARACCRRGHDCIPYSMNPKFKVEDLCTGNYGNRYILESIAMGDMSHSVQVRDDEDEMFRSISGLSVGKSGSGPISTSRPYRGESTSPKAPSQRLVLEGHYQYGTSNSAIALTTCPGCQSGWVAALGLPWWHDYSPYESELPTASLSSHARES